jgi:sugar O-acyltransferase (sialic acid O-acetyltransferase NeuD family)
MNNKKLILIGAGGHAKSCIDVIENLDLYKIGGIIGLPNELGIKIYDYEVIGSDVDLVKLSKSYSHALITVGQIKTPNTRIRLFENAIVAGFEMATIIASSAYVSNRAKIGKGTFVSHGAIVNSNVNIGANCIINSSSLIEHDSYIGNHCHVATGAIINGNNSIGSGSFVGSGAVLREGISVGVNSIIGMGQVVRNNLEDYSEIKASHSL